MYIYKITMADNSKKSFKKKMKKGRGSSTRRKKSAAVKLQKRVRMSRMRRTKNAVEKNNKQKKECKTMYRSCMGYSKNSSSYS